MAKERNKNRDKRKQIGKTNEQIIIQTKVKMTQSHEKQNDRNLVAFGGNANFMREKEKESLQFANTLHNVKPNGRS